VVYCSPPTPHPLMFFSKKNAYVEWFSPLSALRGGYVYHSLVISQGGGIHVEEEFNPCIRVRCLFSPGK
jgi:hypothetical protein